MDETSNTIRLGTGVRVKTNHGAGTVVKRDNVILRDDSVWLVKMDDFEGWHKTYRPGLQKLQETQGGLAFFGSKIKAVAKASGAT